MSNSQNNSEFVYTISEDEIQMFAEHFKYRELTSSEMESMEIRLNKHISCEHIIGAIEDCHNEILE